jgi:hypothetical protein
MAVPLSPPAGDDRTVETSLPQHFSFDYSPLAPTAPEEILDPFEGRSAQELFVINRLWLQPSGHNAVDRTIDPIPT